MLASSAQAAEDSALLDTLFEQAPVGLGLFDRQLRFQRVNDALAAINGVPAADHVGRTVEEILPGLDTHVMGRLRQVLDEGLQLVDTEVVGETPAQPGRSRTWLASFYPVRGADGAIGGIGAVIIEITARREAEEALVRQRDLYEALLQAQSDVGLAVAILEGDRILYANQACERLSGYTIEELIALPELLELVPPEERDPLRERVARRLRDASVEPAYETTILRRDGQRVELELAAKTIPADGRTRLVLVARDITERKRSEDLRALLLDAEREARTQAELAERRSTFLAEASAVLEASLDLDTTCRSVAQLCVPFLGEMCIVDLATPEGMERVAIVGADPERQRMVEEVQRRYPIDPRGEHPLARVVHEGRTQIIASVRDELLESVARDAEHLEMLRAVRFEAAVAAPLIARGRTFGVITVGRFEPGAAYPDRDVALLEDLAGRSALAIDNARVYEERASVARTLQRSLLPPALPEIPGMQLAARYRAAGAGNEVGGDFYDVFEAGDETWAVVIGDVCGKGAPAAAITSLARYTLRAAAMHRRGPSGVLGVLNDALLKEEGEAQFSSVIYAELRPDGERIGLTLSCGGHPLPLLLRAGGEVEAAGQPGTLLGITEEPKLADVAVTLAPGDALVLYTDGVTEARADDGMFGPERLAELVGTCAGCDAEEMADTIARTVVELQAGEPRDDIAVVVLRVG